MIGHFMNITFCTTARIIVRPTFIHGHVRLQFPENQMIRKSYFCSGVFLINGTPWEENSTQGRKSLWIKYVFIYAFIFLFKTIAHRLCHIMLSVFTLITFMHIKCGSNVIIHI